MPVSPADILSRVKDEKVHFMRLQFTDIDGIIKKRQDALKARPVKGAKRVRVTGAVS